MKILAVNAGSSSLKFQAYEMPEEIVLISGVIERIGIAGSFYTIKINGEKIKKEMEIKDHRQAFELVVKELLENNIVKSLDEIKGIGNRVVQGGSYFDKTVVVDDEVISKIDELSPLAPLHNPAAITGIKAAQEVIPNAIQTVVFDTAFHQTMSEVNYLYGLPYEWYTKYGVRRYGAHGTSHKYLALKMREIMKKDDLKLITCHIGNGSSISAIKNGICVNTSMGLTPNAGLIMGTRCGDIDATIIPYIMEKTGMSIKEVDNIMNKQSGFIGISGVSTDYRDIDAGIVNGNERCLLTEQILVHRIVDYIAKYYVELDGCDAIVFTAGLGENAPRVRRDVLNKLKILGIKLDEENNEIRGMQTLITTEDSSIPCYVVPTDEELMIARDTYDLVK